MMSLFFLQLLITRKHTHTLSYYRIVILGNQWFIVLWYLIALAISFPRSGSWFVFSSCRSVKLLLDSIFIDFEFPAWICQFMPLVDFEIHLFLVFVKFFFLSIWLSRKQRKRREKKSKFLNSTVKSFVLVPTVSLVILKHMDFFQ